MKVRVHWNRHKKAWSVSVKGRPVQHFPSLTLQNVEFFVGRGRERCLREGQRNVHAYASGDWDETENVNSCGERVSYNPFLSPHFVFQDGRIIHECREANFLENGHMLCSGAENVAYQKAG